MEVSWGDRSWYMIQPFFKVKKIKDKAHLIFIAGEECWLNEDYHCGVIVEAHHLLRTGEHGMGTKSGDNWAIPLCYNHHRELHNPNKDQHGGEAGFFERYGKSLEQAKTEARRLYEITLRRRK